MMQHHLCCSLKEVLAGNEDGVAVPLILVSMPLCTSYSLYICNITLHILYWKYVIDRSAVVVLFVEEFMVFSALGL